MKTDELELAVVSFFDTRAELIVPNVSWGLGLNYEADLMILNKSEYLYEVELKVSKSDMKADLKKHMAHSCKYVKRLYYAFPEELLETALQILPEDVGLISAYYDSAGRPRVTEKRKPKDRECEKMPIRKQYELARLGALRIWNLKRIIKSRNPYFKQTEIRFEKERGLFDD